MSSNKLKPENKTALTEAQEEILYSEWIKSDLVQLGMTAKKQMLDFARLYHTEATKQTPKSEGVKSAEEMLMKITGPAIPFEDFKIQCAGKEVCTVDECIQAMHEYALQFQQGWQDIASAPKDQSDLLLCRVYSDGSSETFVGFWYQDGERSRWVSNYKNTTPTHWQPLPSPPTPQL